MMGIASARVTNDAALAITAAAVVAETKKRMVLLLDRSLDWARQPYAGVGPVCGVSSCCFTSNCRSAIVIKAWRIDLPSVHSSGLIDNLARRLAGAAMRS